MTMKDVASTPEIQVREQTKKVLHHLENVNLPEARNIIVQFKETLNYNFGKPHYQSLVSMIRFSKTIPKNLDALRMVIDTGFQVYLEDNNTEELVFFAAAKCEVNLLRKCLQLILEEKLDVNNTREGDSVLIFMIKYGNISSEAFLQCLNLLLESGVDVSKVDYNDQTAITLLSKLYDKFRNKAKTNEVFIDNLKKSLSLVSEKFKSNNIDTIQHQLFKFLIEKGEDQFISCLEKNLQCIDEDDGNNTFLQFCCEKNLKSAAKFLIDNGADLSKTTHRNKKHPLEIAARRNNLEIFESLLKEDRIEIDERLFKTFVQIRGRQMKTKYFDMVLKCGSLDVRLKASNGNTPLHYAALFENFEALEKLLDRNASFKVENSNKKSPLDYMNEELKTKILKYIG